MKEFLEKEGYYNVAKIANRGWCGLMRFAFTIGLVYGMDECGYTGRYCFESSKEAQESLDGWDGVGDPSGNWIKHKGKTEYQNPNR